MVTTHCMLKYIFFEYWHIPNSNFGNILTTQPCETSYSHTNNFDIDQSSHITTYIRYRYSPYLFKCSGKAHFKLIYRNPIWCIFSLNIDMDPKFKLWQSIDNLTLWTHDIVHACTNHLRRNPNIKHTYDTVHIYSNDWDSTSSNYTYYELMFEPRHIPV